MKLTRRFRPYAYSLPIALAMAPGLANALEVSFQPRFNSGAMYYEFEKEPVTNPLIARDDGFKINDIMPFVGGGVTLFLGRFYLDGYGQYAFSGEDDALQTGEFTGPLSDPFSISLDSEFERTEYAVTAGYALTDNFAFFVGYKEIFTDFEETDSIEIRNRFFVQQAGVNVIKTNIEKFRTKEEVDFDQDGFFFGGALGTEISRWGFLSVNAAIAFLDGELDGKTTFLDEEIPGQQLPFQFKGDTTGLTVGVAWKGYIPAVKGLSYQIAADGYRYSYDSNDPTQADITETVGRFSVGLSYSF